MYVNFLATFCGVQCIVRQRYPTLLVAKKWEHQDGTKSTKDSTPPDAVLPSSTTFNAGECGSIRGVAIIYLRARGPYFAWQVSHTSNLGGYCCMMRDGQK